jgi:hypothetical protein
VDRLGEAAAGSASADPAIRRAISHAGEPLIAVDCVDLMRGRLA